MAAKIVEEFGYDEVNLNCGCPSQKTINGCFGAQLMYTPDLVAEICQAMIQTVNIPVTVKCRLGVDDLDQWDHLINFITTVSEKGGVNKFILHARKAFLSGLDPKANRNIPPLKYDWVLRLKQEFPHLELVINGGFTNIQMMHDILKEENQLTGCMVGRMAMNNTWELAKFDREFFPHLVNPAQPVLTRRELIFKYADFAQEEQNKEEAKGLRISNTILLRPIINLFHGEFKGGDFRKHIGVAATKPQYLNKIRELLEDQLSEYEKSNPEALETKEGARIVRPTQVFEQNQ
mmetsp:Transcript_8650/g.14652  ORF Transcript_8650/g.14652 Transcript_8650/m.14652 type:complete len:291 (-) Transcript_8650:200-1072(-)|eukprot:CAMPEP_0168610406 /NCGR_PEP_ID=MMETSP0449_2-20121227/1767_1 /TAXON_ID=1082188 /ORGANISM="Strombidium rassoulzadegani, Strain ras09" /LENGTH=290 /DNA_ID=CAMNT_0008650703 /DNA_START=291 /DNA_END=1163 /DNA_ORIENTATION=-